MKGWIFLTLGILTEVAGTFSMKLSHGFTKLVPSILFVIFFIIALSFVNLSMKTIDMSIAYAIWSGVGVSLLTILGIYFLGEPFSLMRLFFISLIIVGVIGLHSQS